MNHYTQIKKDEAMPTKAYHKGMSYAQVDLISLKDGKVFYTYNGGYFREHSRWADLKHFVRKISE